MSVIIMGVAGCGKSSLGRAIAELLKLPVVEGDDFHTPASKAKMSAGIALEDVDRHSWLDRLGAELLRHPGGCVLTCSALKRAYRDRLRSSASQVRFVHLVIDRDTAHERVRARASEHLFPPSLVDSQFETLERPTDEAGVLELDATRPMVELAIEAVSWLLRGRA
jgi:gluconokinase